MPLARAWPEVRRLAVPVAGALVAGMSVAVASAAGLAWLLGASPVTVLSLAPKSLTAPIAMGIAQKIGGLPALAAVFAVATGILGASLGKYILDACAVLWTADRLSNGMAVARPAAPAYDATGLRMSIVA